MAYNHSRKAGNLGDVWKHTVLVAVADVIRGNGRPFRYVECHAGAPSHELTDNGEWRGGVGTITKRTSGGSRYAVMASDWLDRERYPASWVFVADRLARRFQRVEIDLYDSSDQVTAQYGARGDLRIPDNVRLNFRQADGYAEAARLKNGDFVFLDPPYSPVTQKDWRRLRQACRTLMSRRISFAAWYPFYWPTRPEKLRDSTTCEAWEVAWAPCGSRPSQNPKGCGMLVSTRIAALLPSINEELRAVATLHELEDVDSQTRGDWLRHRWQELVGRWAKPNPSRARQGSRCPRPVAVVQCGAVQ